MQDRDPAGRLRHPLRGREALRVDAAVPARDPGGVDAEPGERGVGGGRGGEDDRALLVERAERELHAEHDPRVAGAQLRVGGELRVVRAGDREPEHPRRRRTAGADRAGRADVDEVVAALRERLDEVGHAGHADVEPAVEGDLGVDDARQPAVDVRVGADHVDVEARHAALADLVDHAGDAVHRADPVGEQRDPQRPAAARQAALLAAEERGRRGVGDGGDAGVEEPERRGLEPVLDPGRVERGGGQRGRRGAGAADRGGEPLLVRAARAPVEVRVAEAVVLEVGEQLARRAARGRPRRATRAAARGRRPGRGRPRAPRRAPRRRRAPARPSAAPPPGRAPRRPRRCRARGRRAPSRCAPSAPRCPDPRAPPRGPRARARGTRSASPPPASR